MLAGPVLAQAQTDPSFAVRDVGAVSGVLGRTSSDLELPLALKELAGRTTNLEGPALVSLERDTKAGPIASPNPRATARTAKDHHAGDPTPPG